MPTAKIFVQTNTLKPDQDLLNRFKNSGRWDPSMVGYLNDARLHNDNVWMSADKKYNVTELFNAFDLFMQDEEKQKKEYLDYVTAQKDQPGRAATILTEQSTDKANTVLGTQPNTILGG